MRATVPQPAADSSRSIVIRLEDRRSLLNRIAGPAAVILLAASVLLNAWFLTKDWWFDQTASAAESHVSGVEGAADRIAVIQFTGTISPPFTGRWIRQIQQAVEDDSVKGVILEIDSPGGLVADSHQIYRELTRLNQLKPVWVSMKRIAASGGLYIAMGCGPDGRIFAEPTTWTGSIGVIIPRYNASELVEQYGIRSEPLKTGPLKDSLNPFRDLSPNELEVWDAILDESFQRFVGVIADNRSNLTEDDVRQLATGQVYTTNQSLSNGLVDAVAFTDEVAEQLAVHLGLTEHEVIRYRSDPGLMDLVFGRTDAASPLDRILEAAVPKALYYCSWTPWAPTGSRE